MYDTFYGTQPGVQMFKKALRVQAYSAKCSPQ